jgi:hypothetical protein
MRQISPTRSPIVGRTRLSSYWEATGLGASFAEIERSGNRSSEIAAHYNGIGFTIPDVGVDTTFSGIWISPGGQGWIGGGPNVMRYAP